MKKVLRKLTLEEATNVKGYYSKMFCVAKPDSGTWRPIINLKPMNRFVQKKSFKMETVKHVRSLLRPGHWVTSIDL